jgi:hypothetical protein
MRYEIDGLPPRGRFLGAAGRYHLADDSRQQSRRVLPAGHVEALERLFDEALERLVDEVEGVFVVGERP